MPELTSSPPPDYSKPRLEREADRLRYAAQALFGVERVFDVSAHRSDPHTLVITLDSELVGWMPQVAFGIRELLSTPTPALAPLIRKRTHAVLAQFERETAKMRQVVTP